MSARGNNESITLEMKTYVSLLRAVNVGGTGKLPMSELRAMCAAAGFSDIQTYIASGNAVFASPKSAAQVKSALEKQLEDYSGKPVGVIVRSAEEMSEIVNANPFKKSAPKNTYVLFLDKAPVRDALSSVTGLADEQLHLGKREIYIAYPNGMGRSKLKLPAAKIGTARNLNTVTALAKMASDIFG